MAPLDGDTAVVTGAAQGIGRAIAERLAADGAAVVILDVKDGTEVVESIEADGGEAAFRRADVTDEAALRDAFDGLTIDALVNNAGYWEPLSETEAATRFDRIEREEWDRVMAVNATGVFLATKQAVPHLEPGASVVNISSGTVHKGVPGMLHYVASKAAIIGMTRSMANELGDEPIRVNAVTPGLTASSATVEGRPEILEQHVDSQAISRPIEPADIADAVAYLVGPDSEIVTGQVLNVDGGQFNY